MNPSEEQRLVIESLKQNKNVCVDAVAGSGKSTVVLMAAGQLQEKRFLQITYNSMLRKEVIEKIENMDSLLTNIDVHTYHSLAVMYYSKGAYTDIKMQEVVERYQEPIKELINYDILVLDEIQDMTFLFFCFVVKFIDDMYQKWRKRLQLLILGDTKQSLYEFKGSDVRFLTHAEQIWKDCDYIMNSQEFVRCELRTSYRVTNQIADYVNHVLLGENRLNAPKEGCPVKYISGSAYDNEKRLVGLVYKILDQGYRPDDIFILAGSVKGEYGPVRKLENKLVEKGIPCYVPRDDQERIDERVIKGKVVFSTFHSVKGRQRAFVFVLGFDSSYTDMLSRGQQKDNDIKCPNTLYVACTRASKEMFLFETERDDNRPLPFLQMDHRGMQSQEYVDFLGIPRGPMYYISRDANNIRNNPSVTKPQAGDKKVYYIQPTKLIDFLGYETISKLTAYVDSAYVCRTQPEDKRDIEIPNIIQTGYDKFEDISDLNGIAIPCMFYESVHSEYRRALYDITKRMLDSTYESQYIFLKSQVREKMPEECRTTEDYLLSANMYSAVKEKLYSKLTQIVHYSWITDEKREECIQRMKNWIETSKERIEIEKEIIVVNEDEKQYRINQELANIKLGKDNEEEYEFRFSARVDAITESTLWEFKFVTELSIEHFLQLMIYAWIWRTVYPAKQKKFCLFNIRSNEVYELQNTEGLTDVMKILICSKYNREELETDNEFIEKCHHMLKKTRELSEVISQNRVKDIPKDDISSVCKKKERKPRKEKKEKKPKKSKDSEKKDNTK